MLVTPTLADRWCNQQSTGRVGHLRQPDQTSAVAPPARLQRMPSWLLSQAAVRSHRLLSQALAEVGARGYEYRLLAALDEAGPSSQASLGRSIGLDRRDVAVFIADLATQGAVRRAEDPTDARRNVVTLTTLGRRRLNQLDEVMERVQTQLLAPLQPADRQRLSTLLARLQP